jgi:hypothetical protein
MRDFDVIESEELAALPACGGCSHPASEHVGPEMRCRICGDRYIEPDDDLPSDLLMGE